MAAKQLLPDLATLFPNLSKPAEASYVAISIMLLPPGVFGILLTAMFSATMSSLDTSLNRNSGIITRDIYLTIFNKNASEKVLVKMAKLFTLLFGACVIILAMFFSRLKGIGVFEIMVELGALHALPTGVPLILGLVYKKTPSWSGFLSFTVGLVVATIGKFVFNWSYPEQVLYIVPLCVVLFVLPGFFFPGSEKYRNRRDAFFKKLETPVDEKKEISYYNVDRISHLMVIGMVTMILGVFVICISFFNQSRTNEFISLGIGLVYIVIGVCLAIFGRLQSKRMRRNYAE
jgi:Na+/proline symporter